MKERRRIQGEKPMKVGVFLERWNEEMANFLEGKGIPILPVPKAPQKGMPEELQVLIRRWGIKGAVLVEEEEGLEGGFTEALQEAGIPPYTLEVVRLPSGPLEREAMEQARLLTYAAVERVRAQGEVDPEHLKPTFVSVQEALSRRDLLFGFFKPRYEVIPAVQADRCTAWKGCRLCLEACPQAALSVQEGTIVLDKASCTACGACLPACPEAAIGSPRLNPRTLETQLRALLLRDGVLLEPRVILFASDDGCLALKGVEASLPPQLLEVKLPCTGALSAWLLLRCFDLGADSVVVLPCGPGCRHRCDPEGWTQTFRFVQALLVRIGIEAGRLQTFPALDVKSPRLVAGLQGFVREVKAMGPHSLRGQEGDGPRLHFIDLLRDLSRWFHLEKMAPLTGEEVPFGVVEVVGRCTLCGACPDRCPTGALVMHEGPEASKLTFDHACCIACEACVRVCPEKGLRMERILDFARFTAPSVLAEDQIVSCRRCGKPIAPSRMLQKVRPLLSPQPPAPSPRPLDLEVCPPCRIFEELKRAG